MAPNSGPTSTRQAAHAMKTAVAVASASAFLLMLTASLAIAPSSVAHKRWPYELPPRCSPLSDTHNVSQIQ